MTRRRAGFTLIELVVAMSIIAILTAIAVPRVRDATARAQAARLVETVHQIKTAYAAAGEPTLTTAGSPGVAPPAMAKYVTGGALSAHDGITIQIGPNSSTQPGAFVRLRGSTPGAKQAIGFLAESVPGKQLWVRAAGMLILPLNAAAEAQLP
ncbi:MAG: prepilin-type N-terminal cleavage/methylation domain-containing protein [Gemmatimonadetes bacterium]|nr:prepilin-type N-terminal cleavage/methylation domain-containing protein [Gemmatimonadota bacterium]